MNRRTVSMKKTVLRILGLALILTLLAGIVPASAEGGSGFGGNLKWELKNGVLTISGTGAMNDFNSNSIAPPWRQYRNEITSAVIEPGCTYIGSFAFEYCNLMSSITIPETVKGYGMYALGESGIANVIIPAAFKTFPEGLFSYCQSLNTVYLPKGLTEIGNCAFQGCNSMHMIVIPSGVKKIGFCAFAQCEMLSQVGIPATVTKIDQDAFADCGQLTEVRFGGTEAQWNKIVIESGNEFLQSANIIFDPALPKVTNWQAKDGSVYTLGLGEYASLYAIPKNVTTYKVPDTITVNKRKLKVSAVTEHAGAGLSKLQKLEIGKNVIILAMDAFPNCKALTTVTGGANLQYLGQNAFRNCVRLKNIPTFPALEYTFGSAFAGCKSLTAFTLGKQLKFLGENTFQGCSALKKITIQTTQLTADNIGENAFKGINSGAVFQVPAGKLNAYKKILLKKGATKKMKFEKLGK